MTLKRTITIAIAVSAILSALPSCVKQKLELTYTAQEESIDKYVKSVLDTAKTASATYNEGICRLTKVQGRGEPLKGNGTVSFYYAGYTFSNRFSKENLFCTNHEATAADAKWTLPEEELTNLTVCLNDADFLEGLKKGLSGVRAGEECEIIFSAKYGFGRKPFGIVPANSALLYKIWVKSISNE